jgi:biopolymer transport protein ExbD
MSAQFVDIYQIGSDAPITSTTNTKMDKEPLNLTLKLTGEKVSLHTGLDEKLFKSYNLSQLDLLNQDLIELKKQNPTEKSAILKPAHNFQYKKIVKIIDHTREIIKPDVYITAIDEKNRKYASKKLFDRIIFETQD